MTLARDQHLSHPHQLRFSVAVEDIVLWIGAILGIASFAWQIFQWLGGRSERKSGTLNNKVLKPWSHVRLEQVFGEQTEPNSLAFVVPKTALHPDAGPVVPEYADSIDVYQLVGFVKAHDFLGAKHRDLGGEWFKLEFLMEDYNSLLDVRRELIEPMVKEGMAAAYPNLRAANHPPGSSDKDVYFVSQIAKSVAQQSYTYANYPNWSLELSRSQTTLKGEIRFTLGGPYALVYQVAESDADEAKMRQLMERWIHDRKLRELNVQLFQMNGRLEARVAQFRMKLSELCLEIEQTGG